MPRLTEIQTSFSSGEIDPTLRAQTDLKAYNNGALRLRNLARLSTGGVETRPPTLDLVALPGKTRLVDFEFSNTQRYVVALYAEGLTVFDTTGLELQSITGAPWAEDELEELSYSQNADVMTITHHNFFVDLKRLSYATFSLTDSTFDHSADDLKVYQPYYKFAADEVTLTPSAGTGTITVEASANVFLVGHVGQRFRIYTNEVEITAVTDGTTATAEVKGKLEGKFDLDPFRTTRGSGVVEVLHPLHGLSSGASITFAGANDVGVDADGLNGITGAQLTGTFPVTVIDEHTYSISTAGTAATSEDGGGSSVSFSVAGTPVRDWQEPSINSVNGYPVTVCFHEGRRWLAGTPMQPDAFFGSNALKPFRFDVGKGFDGESVQGAAAFESVGSIRHIISNGDLQLFTATAEGVFVTRPGEPITPSSVRVNGASGAGCGNVMPQVFDGATLFVQENGLSVHELVYSDQMQRYMATPVSSIAGHLLKSKAVDCAVSPGSTSSAEQFAYFPVGDGGMAVFHSQRTENIAGWTFWTLGLGAIRSVCTLGNELFLAVEREGAWRLYKTLSGVRWLLDGAVQHVSGTATTNWTLDARVRGRTVGLYSERGYHGTAFVPANGVITISLAVETLAAGDPYFLYLQTVSPRIEMPGGSRDRMLKRIVRAVVELEDTSSIVIDGSPIVLRETGVDPAVAVAPFSGSYEFRRLGYSRNPTIEMSQEEPSFARILGITLEVQT